MTGLDRLERASLLLVIGGIIMIYVASVVYVPPDVSVGEIDEAMVGEMVRVEGNITAYTEQEEATFMTLHDGTGELDLVSFDPVTVQPYNTYTVEGRVEVYRGSLELIVSEIS